MSCSRSTPKRFGVPSAIIRMSDCVLGAGSTALPSTPIPPALDTAITSGGYDTNPIPALTNGYRTPYSRVSRVVRAPLTPLWSGIPATRPSTGARSLAAAPSPMPAPIAARAPPARPSSASIRRRSKLNCLIFGVPLWSRPLHGALTGRKITGGRNRCPKGLVQFRFKTTNVGQGSAAARHVRSVSTGQGESQPASWGVGHPAAAEGVRPAGLPRHTCRAPCNEGTVACRRLAEHSRDGHRAEGLRP